MPIARPVGARFLAIEPPQQPEGGAAPAMGATELAAAITAAWEHCRSALETGDKDAFRRLHIQAKSHDTEVKYADLRKDLAKLRRYFPEPPFIDPSRIDPVLVPAPKASLEGRLFKIVRGYWSMPYSKGYGRRLRFLVMDRHHQAVIGIIGLQSPSADLGCRDSYFGVEKSKKLAVVNNTMDAYTIGSTPAYAPLLAGKLVAGLLHSPIVRQGYWRAYGHGKTTQLDNRIPQPLLAITTSSAFGRSSLYNRLKFGKWELAKPIGYTRGFGTVHLEPLYPHIVNWLKANGRHVPAGFGNGPKVRWQNIMRALCDLGISRDYLSHGFRRQVFLFELATNLVDVLREGALPQMTDFDDANWAEYWKDRWCMPRVERTPDWSSFHAFQRLQDALNPAA
jgi:hypothetical protein